MKSRLVGSCALTTTFALTLIVLSCAPPGFAAPQSQPAPQTSTQGKAFDTPQQAAEAVVKAAGDYNVPDLMAIFGPDGKNFISGGDQVQDKNNAVAFGKEAAAKNSISTDPTKPNLATIIVGDGEWPFPVPLI